MGNGPLLAASLLLLAVNLAAMAPNLGGLGLHGLWKPAAAGACVGIALRTLGHVLLGG